jgi:hypothetical protein
MRVDEIQSGERAGKPEFLRPIERTAAMMGGSGCDQGEEYGDERRGSDHESSPRGAVIHL